MDYQINDLIKKISNEHEELIDGFLKKAPQEIIDSAYEIHIKNEITTFVENFNLGLSQKQINALMSSKNTLDEIYDNWISSDTYNAFEDIEFCIKDTSEPIISYQERSSKKSISSESKETSIDKKGTEKINPDFYTNNKKNLYVTDPMLNKKALSVINIFDSTDMKNNYSALIDYDKGTSMISVINDDKSIEALSNAINEAQDRAIRSVKEKHSHVYNSELLNNLPESERFYVKDIKDPAELSHLCHRLDKDSYYVNHTTGTLIVSKSDIKSMGIIKRFRQHLKENKSELTQKKENQVTISRRQIKENAEKASKVPSSDKHKSHDEPIK